MNFSPFSCPIFLGHTEARGRCSQSERVLYGRDLCRSGGTGKAEAAKLQGAGIGPKQCPRKWGRERWTCRTQRIDERTEGLASHKWKKLKRKNDAWRKRSGIRPTSCP